MLTETKNPNFKSGPKNRGRSDGDTSNGDSPLRVESGEKDSLFTIRVSSRRSLAEYVWRYNHSGESIEMQKKHLLIQLEGVSI